MAHCAARRKNGCREKEDAAQDGAPARSAGTGAGAVGAFARITDTGAGADRPAPRYGVDRFLQGLAAAHRAALAGAGLRGVERRVAGRLVPPASAESART